MHINQISYVGIILTAQIILTNSKATNYNII